MQIVSCFLVKECQCKQTSNWIFKMPHRFLIEIQIFILLCFLPRWQLQHDWNNFNEILDSSFLLLKIWHFFRLPFPFANFFPISYFSFYKSNSHSKDIQTNCFQSVASSVKLNEGCQKRFIQQIAETFLTDCEKCGRKSLFFFV